MASWQTRWGWVRRRGRGGVASALVLSSPPRHPPHSSAGKTLQSISLLAYTQEYLGSDGPHLVLVPKSTLGNWITEFGRFCPSLKVLKLHGDKDERSETIKAMLHPGEQAAIGD